MDFLINHIWLFALVPLLAGVFVFLFGRRLPGRGAPVTIAAMGLCLAAALALLMPALRHGGPLLDRTFTWFSAAGAPIEVGFIVDALTAVMLVVVTLVSLLVQVYSTEYMHGDPGYGRYFAYLSVFTFAMLLLVITNNFMVMYIAWELVGLCSYLLIGFWYEKKSASNASKKAFLTTKVGDVGFLLGLLLLYYKVGTFHFGHLYDAVRAALESGRISPTYLAVTLILLFGGAVGKSAQFPLHTWLPDAMEGPTPVSALIHAATMVAAGVYLVGRAFPLFLLSKGAILFVAYTGAVTALFAASIALVMTDIKKVLAYSTISQLGFMMLGLGVGGYVAGLFHLVTHAFFKGLLFLAAGAVIHALHGEQDIRRMGNLRARLPVIFWLFAAGWFGICAVPPGSGFFSKDAILHAALVNANGGWGLYLVGLLTGGLTAFYMSRLFFLAFFTGERLTVDPKRIHDAPAVMALPMGLLALLALGGGLLPLPAYLGAFFPAVEEARHVPEWAAALLSTLAALAGIGGAWVLYVRKPKLAVSLQKTFAFPQALARGGWQVDAAYDAVFGRGTVAAATGLERRLDAGLIDGVLLHGSAAAALAAGRTARKFQTGALPDYLLAMLTGALVLLWLIAR